MDVLLKINNIFFPLELNVRINEPLPALSAIPSMDVEETNETKNRPLAPLASSETLTEVNVLGVNENKVEATARTPKGNFDSLELLFDFPSSGISNDTQLDDVQTPESLNQIRFAPDDETMSPITTKVCPNSQH